MFADVRAAPERIVPAHDDGLHVVDWVVAAIIVGEIAAGMDFG